ncbi:hypothetical protein FSP39_011063 [Pinctada imbricata]|uniref:Cytochrome c oxidase assembly protein COX11, mitochondrial n=1 Tax=Pinctada imbricata TaxID=66713 RepID=A0AA89BWV0_PINIB|nr:hypothetical protein FSP39_011063 [Pinctada imbricata]
MALYNFRGFCIKNNRFFAKEFSKCTVHSQYFSSCSFSKNLTLCRGSLAKNAQNKHVAQQGINRTVRNFISSICIKGYDCGHSKLEHAHKNSCNVFLTPKSQGLNINSIRCRADDYDSELRRYKRSRNPFHQENDDEVGKNTVMYLAAMAIFFLGASYAAVPLYRAFCQKTGRGGKSVQAKAENVEKMKPGERELTIQFNADVDSSMRWNFRPQQTEVKVRSGETALAFYTAMNPADKPIIGISTYSVIPWEAGAYFNKIQCFCFEEQRLNPGEQVDMPVFFFIDPEIENDPALDTCSTITLSYTFFESKDDLNLPYPGYATKTPPIMQPNTA